jgi:hypothetical protein
MAIWETYLKRMFNVILKIDFYNEQIVWKEIQHQERGQAIEI